MNEAQKKKRNFRQSKRWREFRIEKRKEQKNIDIITLKRLSKTANLHHLDLNELNYEDISDVAKFVFINRQTHEFIHWLYNYYKTDKSVIVRIVEVLERMAKINKEK